MRRRFQGSKDPNAIILEDLFPLTNIKVSTELKENQGLLLEGFQEFVFEGEEEYLRFIETNSHPLEKTGWRLGDPLTEGDGELRIFRKLRGDLSEHIEVPVFRGWHDLGDHFFLANRIRLTVQKDSVCIFEMTCDLLDDGSNKEHLLRIKGPNKLPFMGTYRFLN